MKQQKEKQTSVNVNLKKISSFFKPTSKHPKPVFTALDNDIEMEDLDVEEMDWDDIPFLTNAQIAKLEMNKTRAMRLRRQKVKQKEFKEHMKRKKEGDDMKEFLSGVITERLEAGLAEPTTSKLVDTSDISIVSIVNILNLADRMCEDSETFEGKVAARGLVMGWRLELHMCTTQEWKDKRNLPAMDIVDKIIDRTIHEVDNNSRRVAHRISVEVVNNILEVATTSLEVHLDAQFANLRLDTTDEIDALPSPPITAMTANTLYVPDTTACMPLCTWWEDDNDLEMTAMDIEAFPNPPITANTVDVPDTTACMPLCTWWEDDINNEMTAMTAMEMSPRTSRKRRRRLRKTRQLRRTINVPDLSNVYDEMGVYTPKFWDNPAVRATDNTTYSDIKARNETESEKTTPEPDLIPEKALGGGENEPHFNSTFFNILCGRRKPEGTDYAQPK